MKTDGEISMFIAHIHSDGTIQTCRDHSQNTAMIARDKLASVGLSNAAYLAGLLHDCGKYTDEFLSYIQKAVKGEAQRGSVTHSFAGGVFLLNQYHVASQVALDYRDLTAELLASAIMNHHGLIDLINPEGKSGFQHRLTKQPEYEQRAIKGFFRECVNREQIDDLFEKAVTEIRDFLEKLPKEASNDEMFYYLGVLSRLLTSAVVAGDRTDTACFMMGKKTQTTKNPLFSWDDCRQTIEKYLSQFLSETPVQKARSAFSHSAAEFGKHPSGIYRLDLPTGGGKTLTSLRYAVCHANEYGKQHIIYVAPLLSIVEQNASVIRKAVGHEEWVLEHHSNVTVPEADEGELTRIELLQETWDSPIIITTLVRLLEVLFSGHMVDVRRMHTLCNSILIIDEVQSIPRKMISMFNCAINFLSSCCQTTVILCSATQPPFDKADHRMMIAADTVVDSDTLLRYSPLFKRTKITYDSSLQFNEIVGHAREILDQTDNLLIVCNTKDEAANLYEAMRDLPFAKYHLSAGMCMAHRQKVLQKLQEALARKERLLCISTQVIEAGIDISFGAVIRFSAGLDSIVQCAGRCNRNGEYKENRPVRIVINEGQELGKLEDIIAGQNALNDLLVQFLDNPDQFHGDIASDESVEYYYGSLFKAMKKNAQDYPAEPFSLFEMLGSNEGALGLSDVAGCYCLNQAFKTAADLFSVFDEDTCSLLVPYGDGKKIICDLETDRARYDLAYCREKLKEAKMYTVSVPYISLQKMREEGAVRAICNEVVYAAAPYCYDEQTGLLSRKRIKEMMKKCDTLIL